MDDGHVVAAGSAADATRLCQKVRTDYPRARLLTGLSFAQPRSRLRKSFYDVWLDFQGEVLIVLEHGRAPDTTVGSVTLRRIPLRSPACQSLLAGLAGWIIRRLDGAAVEKRFSGLFDALAALEDLFEVQLAVLRLAHRGSKEVDLAIQDQIDRARTSQEVARRRAFRDWHVRSLRGGHDEVTPQDAADALGYACALPNDLVQMLGAWTDYQETIIGAPSVDPSPRHRSRGSDRVRRYFEFRAVRQGLSFRQRGELNMVVRNASVRPEVMTIDLMCEQDDGYFPWDMWEIVGRYFDAGLHFDQSGERTLCFRLPASLLDRLMPYELSGAVEITGGSEGDLVVQMIRQEADGELTYLHTDPTSWLSELLPLRDGIVRGDLRALQIAWQAGIAQGGHVRGEVVAPPQQSGMDDLTPGLLTLNHFLTHIP